MHVFSNDPYQPRLSCTVVGTGLTGTGASLGNNYVAIRRAAAPVSHVRSDTSGSFPLRMGPGTPFSYVAFDPETGLVSHQNGVTDTGGQFSWEMDPVFYASTEPDSDGDGLPDDVEFAIGSRVAAADTNGDGLDDFQSLAQGIHPGEPSSRTDAAAIVDEFGFGFSGWPVTLAGGAGLPAKADAGGLTAELLEPLIAEATASWSTAGADPDNLAAMRFEIVDLPGLALGRTFKAAEDEFVVSIDVDGGGYGWFIDQTPETAEEFARDANGQLAADSTSEAFEAVDLLTVVTHELGHVLGLADRPSAEELVMGARLPLGLRRVPTATVLEGPQLDHGLTDFGWYNGVDPPGYPHELINGDFAVSDPGSSEFGWSLRGDASVADEHGVLGETGPLNAGITQTFLVPDGARYLRFDVIELDLHATALGPPDAFEVALLDPVTMSPLVGPAEGLSGTDALLNVQADGGVFFAPALNLPFLATSGETLDLAFPFTVEIALPEMDAGTEVSLYFDLLGFGDDDSSVRVDNVLLSETQLLALSLQLDPATDSGAVGDALTNFSVVNLIGKTQPGMEVRLGLDGDEFDDGVVTSDAAGVFVFENVPLAPGENPLRTRVTRGEESLTAELTVTLDAQPPTATLISPAAGTTITSDAGWIDVQWNDDGSAGLDATTFDTGDVSISGVTIDDVEVRGNGVVRYLYGQDGDQLAFGPVVVTTNAGEVADLAANTNAVREFSFVLEESAVEVPPVVDLNGPEATGTEYSSTFTEGFDAVSIADSALSIRNVDSVQLTRARVRITNAHDGESELLLVETGETGISAAYDAGQGVLQLSGAGSLSAYEAVLRTLRYENSSWDPDRETRRIEVVVSDGTSDSEPAVSSVEVIASTHGISGYVYVDVNNDGLKGASEMGLPNVPVRLEGSVSRVVLTGADGGYYLGDLPSGRYSVHETQPMAFMDGRETAGGPVDCEMGEDAFYDLELRGPDTHAAGYNFGERGLRAELVTKQLFLSSSPSGDEMLRQLDVVGGKGWYPFVAAHDASVTVDLGSGVEEPLIEIYGEGWLPVRLSPGERAATAEVEEGESYVFYVSGGGLEIVNVSLRLDRSGVYTNPAAALDVSADGYVSPIDVLWIIDYLNEPDERPVAGLSESGEGESVVLASGRVGETAHCMGVGDAAREVGLVSAVVEERVSTARTAGLVVGAWGAGAEREMGDAGLVTARDAMLGVDAARADGSPAEFAVSGESWSVVGERDARWSGGVGREAWLSLGLDEMVVDHGGRAGRLGRWYDVPLSGGAAVEDVLSSVARGGASSGSAVSPRASWPGSDGLAAVEAWRPDSDESEGEERLLSSDLESLLTDLAEDVVRSKAWLKR